MDDTGFIETTSLSTKRRGRGGKANPKTKASQRRKNLQKPKYVFVQAIKNDNAYNDYFNPDPEVEKRLLELSDLVSCVVFLLIRYTDQMLSQKPERKSRKKKNDAQHAAAE